MSDKTGTRMDVGYFKRIGLEVLNCTHYDLDGAGSHLVLKTIYPTATCVKMFYGKGDAAAFESAVKLKRYDAIVFTDYTPTGFMPMVESSGVPTLVLDHHASASLFNDPSNNVFVDPSACGSRLAYEFYRKVNDISHLDDLIGYIDTFDRWIRTDKKRFEHAFRLNVLFKMKYRSDFVAWTEAYKDGHVGFSEDDMKLIDSIEREVDSIYGNLRFTSLPGGGVLTRCDRMSTEVGIRIQDSQKYAYWINLYNNVRSNNVGIMFRGYDSRISFDKFADTVVSATPGAISMGGHGLASGGQAVDDASALAMVSKSVGFIERQLDGTFGKDSDVGGLYGLV